MARTEQNQVFLTPDVYSGYVFSLSQSRECSMSPFFQKPRQAPHLIVQANGFVLLEVLVAMSIVASSWIALEGSYQHLVLRMALVQEKKAAINRESDQYEIALFTAMQSDKPDSKLVLNESSGMSRRSRLIPRAGGPVNKK
jgi:prepilin-type N-terminal cleavage/methylation domain-containing protein